MNITFEEVKAYGKRRVTVDGKKKYQQKTFVETINPFNKNPDGTVKSRAEVQESVDRKCDEWQSETINE